MLLEGEQRKMLKHLVNEQRKTSGSSSSSGAVNTTSAQAQPQAMPTGAGNINNNVNGGRDSKSPKNLLHSTRQRNNGTNGANVGPSPSSKVSGFYVYKKDVQQQRNGQNGGQFISGAQQAYNPSNVLVGVKVITSPSQSQTQNVATQVVASVPGPKKDNMGHGDELFEGQGDHTTRPPLLSEDSGSYGSDTTGGDTNGNYSKDTEADHSYINSGLSVSTDTTHREGYMRSSVIEPVYIPAVRVGLVSADISSTDNINIKCEIKVPIISSFSTSVPAGVSGAIEVAVHAAREEAEGVAIALVSEVIETCLCITEPTDNTKVEPLQGQIQVQIAHTNQGEVDMWDGVGLNGSPEQEWELEGEFDSPRDQRESARASCSPLVPIRATPSASSPMCMPIGGQIPYSTNNAYSMQNMEGWTDTFPSQVAPVLSSSLELEVNGLGFEGLYDPEDHNNRPPHPLDHVEDAVELVAMAAKRQSQIRAHVHANNTNAQGSQEFISLDEDLNALSDEALLSLSELRRQINFDEVERIRSMREINKNKGQGEKSILWAEHGNMITNTSMSANTNNSTNTNIGINTSTAVNGPAITVAVPAVINTPATVQVTSPAPVKAYQVPGLVGVGHRPQAQHPAKRRGSGGKSTRASHTQSPSNAQREYRGVHEEVPVGRITGANVATDEMFQSILESIENQMGATLGSGMPDQSMSNTGEGLGHPAMSNISNLEEPSYSTSPALTRFIDHWKEQDLTHSQSRNGVNVSGSGNSRPSSRGPLSHSADAATMASLAHNQDKGGVGLQTLSVSKSNEGSLTANTSTTRAGAFASNNNITSKGNRARAIKPTPLGRSSSKIPLPLPSKDSSPIVDDEYLLNTSHKCMGGVSALDSTLAQARAVSLATGGAVLMMSPRSAFDDCSVSSTDSSRSHTSFSSYNSNTSSVIHSISGRSTHGQSSSSPLRPRTLSDNGSAHGSSGNLVHLDAGQVSGVVGVGQVRLPSPGQIRTYGLSSNGNYSAGSSPNVTDRDRKSCVKQSGLSLALAACDKVSTGAGAETGAACDCSEVIKEEKEKAKDVGDNGKGEAANLNCSAANISASVNAPGPAESQTVPRNP